MGALTAGRWTIALAGVLGSCGVAAGAPPGFVSTIVGDASRMDAVTISPAGTAEAFATHLPGLYATPFRSLQTALPRGGGGWSPAAPLPGGDTLTVIATSPAGNLVAVAWRTTERSTAIDIATRVQGAWSPVTTLPVSGDTKLSDAVALGNISAAIDDGGSAAIAWSAGGLLSGTTRAQSGWSPRIRLYRGDARPGRPAVAVNAPGDAVVAAWGTRGLKRRPLVIGYRRDRHRWTAPRTVPYVSDRAYFEAPTAVLSDAGRADVAWSDQARVWVATGGIASPRWAPPRPIALRTRGVYGVALRGDRSSRLVVAWTGIDGRIRLRTRLATGNWVATKQSGTVGVGLGLGERLAIALNARGAGVVGTAVFRQVTPATFVGGVLAVHLEARPLAPYGLGRTVREERAFQGLLPDVRAAINDAGEVVVGWTLPSGSNAEDTVEAIAGRL